MNSSQKHNSQDGEKACRYCGALVSSGRSSKAYCSDGCKQAAYYWRRKQQQENRYEQLQGQQAYRNNSSGNDKQGTTADRSVTNRARERIRGEAGLGTENQSVTRPAATFNNQSNQHHRMENKHRTAYSATTGLSAQRQPAGTGKGIGVMGMKIDRDFISGLLASCSPAQQRELALMLLKTVADLFPDLLKSPSNAAQAGSYPSRVTDSSVTGGYGRDAGQGYESDSDDYSVTENRYENEQGSQEYREEEGYDHDGSLDEGMNEDDDSGDDYSDDEGDGTVDEHGQSRNKDEDGKGHEYEDENEEEEYPDSLPYENSSRAADKRNTASTYRNDPTTFQAHESGRFYTVSGYEDAGTLGQESSGSYLSRFASSRISRGMSLWEELTITVPAFMEGYVRAYAAQHLIAAQPAGSKDGAAHGLVTLHILFHRSHHRRPVCSLLELVLEAEDGLLSKADFKDGGMFPVPNSKGMDKVMSVDRGQAVTGSDGAQAIEDKEDWEEDNDDGGPVDYDCYVMVPAHSYGYHQGAGQSYPLAYYEAAACQHNSAVLQALGIGVGRSA
jgi:hypothetical protein